MIPPFAKRPGSQFAGVDHHAMMLRHRYHCREDNTRDVEDTFRGILAMCNMARSGVRAWFPSIGLLKRGML